MKIILDSNILFSALIKDSKTRRIILEYEGFYLFPQYIFEEMKNHIEELLKKSRLSKQEFDTLLAIILKKVAIVPNESLLPFRNKALEIVKDIDKDDVLFVACALAYPDSIIWSNDKKLKRQKIIKVLDTEEILKI